MNSIGVEPVVLVNDYRDFNEAIGYCNEIDRGRSIALYSTLRYADTVQECEIICNKVIEASLINRNTLAKMPQEAQNRVAEKIKIYKGALTRMSQVGRIQVEHCQTIDEAIEIKTIASRDIDLQSLAIYKAIDLMTEFKDVYKIIDHIPSTDYEMDAYFWKRALEIAIDYEDFNLIIAKSPRSIHERWLKKAAKIKQAKIMKKTLANSTLKELGELFYNPVYSAEKSAIRKKYAEIFYEKLKKADDFSSYRKLFEMYEMYGGLAPRCNDNTFLEPMLRLSENFGYAKFVYDAAINKRFRTLALAQMCSTAITDFQKNIAKSKPEFKIIAGTWPQWLYEMHHKIFETEYAEY